MYLINFRFFKSLELTIDHLKIKNLERNFDLEATRRCNNLY
jgi:hypothetical protein